MQALYIEAMSELLAKTWGSSEQLCGLADQARAWGTPGV